MLAEKYSHILPAGKRAFLLFDSKLTSAGNVEITSGAVGIITKTASRQIMKEILEENRLNAVLHDLGIKS